MPRKEVIKVQQLGLFTKEEVRLAEPMTRVSLRRKSAQVPLRARRRQATAKLKEVLASLEGKDILISYCGGSHSHWWFNDLKLSHLKVDWGLFGGSLPGVVVLWGVRKGWRQQSLRIFLDQLVDVRQQSYNSKSYWYVDFWNGFGESPIDPYKPKGYESIEIVLVTKS
jgi:hypothetical protein